MDPTRCPECGSPLTTEQARSGTCPACMLRLGLDAAETSPQAEPSQSEPSRDPGSIGPYRILRQLGEGGMGVVYLAEQTAPVRRQVALKVVRHGIGTRDVIRRFDAERQALALMDHPSIARVFDAGETPDGLPYFAMEYVEGEPITAYCDRERLAMRERLELLAAVCLAVQHAHRRGVIHRDIKPSNVLVTLIDGKAVPKVIDFGVAKAIEQRATERSLFTELGMIVGTPEYMSPEQAEFTGERVDTRTDVYSLGVLQYELMTGVLPFDPAQLRAGGFDQICRRIREEEPSRPSARVSGGEAATQSARLRRVDVATLHRQLTGELDWVAMKALEKDPERRYGSPQELADDLHRYLRHEPVLAGPPSAAYKLRKFVRRNRFGVASAAAVLVALIAGAIAATTFAVREAAQRREAEAARARLEKVVDFQSRMISGVEPDKMGVRLVADLRRRVGDAARGGGTAAEAEALERQLDAALKGVNGTDAALRVLDEEILERAARVIEAEFAGEPLIEARLRASLAETYNQLGLHERARPHGDRSLELRRRELGDQHADTLRALLLSAHVHFSSGRYEEAEAAYREAGDGLSRALGPDHAETLGARHGLGSILRQRGRYEEGEPLLLETLEARRRLLGPEAPATLDSMVLLSDLYALTRRYTQAEPLLVEVVNIRKRVLGPDHRVTLDNAQMLAATTMNLGRMDEAEAMFLSVLDTQRRSLGSRHPSVLMTLGNLASLYVRQFRYDDAAAAYGEALAISQSTWGPDHFNTITVTVNSAALQVDLKRLKEAEALYESGLRSLERIAPDHQLALLTRVNLGLVYQRQGRHQEASRAFREAAEHPKATADVKLQAARCFSADTPGQDLATAVRYATEAVEMTGRGDLGSLRALASALAKAGRIEEAASVHKEIVAKPEAGVLEFNSYAWFLLTRTADDPANAPIALEYAIKANEPSDRPNPDRLDTLALAYHRTGQSEKAVETVERALELVAPDDAARRDPFLKRLEEFRAGLAGVTK